MKPAKKKRFTYHADCLCGRPITSETRETACPDCERLLVFEWGGDLFEPASVQIDETKKNAVVIVGEKTKGEASTRTKGASA